MSSKHVWRPGVSYAPATVGSEEGGRGSLHASSSEQVEVKAVRKKASIPRRRTPTVHIPPPAALNCSESNNSPSTDTGSPAVYKTIEKNKKQSLLEFSRKPYEKSKAPNPRSVNWFCGWTEFEHVDLHCRPPVMTATDDRTRLQTPGDGYRSSLQSRVSSSRYSSSRGGRRAYHYTFRHFAKTEDHIENYRALYCFTTLNSDPCNRQDEDRVYCEGEDVEQDAEVTLPLGVKSLYRGDPYIRELVSRLGIREPPPEDWGKIQQLLTSPRPTPPSIVKKRKDGKDTVDMVVANSAPKRHGMDYFHDTYEDDVLPNFETPSPDADKEPSTATQQFGSVELPKITHSSQIPELLRQLHHHGNKNDKHKSNSVISVNKYLRVKSKNQDTLVEEREDSSDSAGETGHGGEVLRNASKRTPHHRVARPAKDDIRDSTGERSKEAYRDGKERVEGSKGAEVKVQHRRSSHNSLVQDHSVTLTKGQKEKLITNAAHVLGVVSRDWAKTPGKVTKMMQESAGEKPRGGKLLEHQESAASGGTHSKHRSPETRTSYRNQITTPVPGSFKGGSTHRPPAATVQREREGDAEKIEKLKSIYSQSRNSKAAKSVQPSRQASRCSSRHPTRPPTRVQGQRSEVEGRRSNRAGEGQDKRWQWNQSRPVTRMGHGGEFHSRPVTGMRGRDRRGEVHSRPITSLQSRRGASGDVFPSRPMTRTGNSTQDTMNLESLEESTYWNELPQENPVSDTAGHMTTDNSTKSATTSHMTAENTAMFGLMEENGKSGSKKGTGVGLMNGYSITTGWNEDLSLMVSRKRREMGGKEASTDKIAQAIALAMKFRQPRESLMRKLTGGRGEGARGAASRKGVAMQQPSPQDALTTKQLTKAKT